MAAVAFRLPAPLPVALYAKPVISRLQLGYAHVAALVAGLVAIRAFLYFAGRIVMVAVFASAGHFVHLRVHLMRKDDSVEPNRILIHQYDVGAPGGENVRGSAFSAGFWARSRFSAGGRGFFLTAASHLRDHCD